MAQALKYKKPRRINVVSVSLALAAALVAYLTYQYLPLYLQKQEARRVLEENSSKFAGRRGYYVQDARAREGLRMQMQSELGVIGINDPEIETWIEIEGNEAHFGVVYSAWVEWPYDIIERHEMVNEVEHVIPIRRK